VARQAWHAGAAGAVVQVGDALPPLVDGENMGMGTSAPVELGRRTWVRAQRIGLQQRWPTGAVSRCSGQATKSIRLRTGNRVKRVSMQNVVDDHA
jgi:hypothetical protein